MGAVTTVLEVVFWSCVVLLAYAQVGYPLLLAALARVKRPRRRAPPIAPAATLPSVSLVVAAYDEGAVIGAKVANALALDYPRDRLEVIVASDGSADGTVSEARRAGADLVLDLPRGGKIRAQDAAVAPRARRRCSPSATRTRLWEPGALRTLVARVRRRQGRLRLRAGAVRHPRAGTNQEGLYWRYEMALRALESKLGSITAGNGAIYATRRDSYIEVDPVMGHDLSFPFNMVKRGWRAVYVPGGARDGEDGPVDRGRVRPQAADDEPRLADRPARRPAVAARLPAAVRADARLAPRAALRGAVPARRRVRRERAAGRHEPGLRGRARAAARAARRRAAGRRGPRCARCSSRATTS